MITVTRTDLPPYVEEVLTILKTHSHFWIDNGGCANVLCGHFLEGYPTDDASWTALLANAYTALDWIAKTHPEQVWRQIDTFWENDDPTMALFRWHGEDE